MRQSQLLIKVEHQLSNRVCIKQSQRYIKVTQYITSMSDYSGEWTTITGDASLALNKAYAIEATALPLLQLPDYGLGYILLYSKNAVGYRLTQRAGQQIHYGNQYTTPGITGRLTSLDHGDFIAIRYAPQLSMWSVTGDHGNFMVE